MKETAMPSASGGSLKSVVYKYFKVEEQGTKKRKSRVSCVLCRQGRCGEYERMLEHLCTKCSNRYRIPQDDREQMRRQFDFKRTRREQFATAVDDSTGFKRVKGEEDALLASMVLEGCSKAPNASARPMEDTMEVLKLFAEFVVAFNLPSQMTENEFFRFFMQNLNGRLRLPHDLLLLAPCFNMLHGDIRAQIHLQVQNAKSLGLFVSRVAVPEAGVVIVQMDGLNDQNVRIPIHQVSFPAREFNPDAAISGMLTQIRCLGFVGALTSATYDHSCFESAITRQLSESCHYVVECFLSQITDLFLSLFMEVVPSKKNPLHAHLFRALKVFTYFHDSKIASFFDDGLQTITSVYFTLDRYHRRLYEGSYEKTCPWEDSVVSILQNSWFWSDLQNVVQILSFYQRIRQVIASAEHFASDCFLLYLVVGNFWIHVSPIRTYSFPYLEIFERYFQHYLFANSHLGLLTYYLDNRYKGYHMDISLPFLCACFRAHAVAASAPAATAAAARKEATLPESSAAHGGAGGKSGRGRSSSEGVDVDAPDGNTRPEPEPSAQLRSLQSGAASQPLASSEEAPLLPPLTSEAPFSEPSLPSPPPVQGLARLPASSPAPTAPADVVAAIVAAASSTRTMSRENAEIAEFNRFMKRYLDEPRIPTSPLFFWSTIPVTRMVPFRQTIEALFRVKPLIPVSQDEALTVPTEEQDRDKRLLCAHMMRFHLDLKYPLFSGRPGPPKVPFFSLPLADPRLCRAYSDIQLELICQKLDGRSLRVDLHEPVRELTQNVAKSFKGIMNSVDPPYLMSMLLRQSPLGSGGHPAAWAPGSASHHAGAAHVAHPSAAFPPQVASPNSMPPLPFSPSSSPSSSSSSSSSSSGLSTTPSQ